MVKKKYPLNKAKKFATDFVRYLKEEKDIPIQAAYIYGSYARQTARNWSDLDVAIVSPKIKNGGSFSYLGKLRRDIDIDRLISPIGFHPQDFKSELNPLVDEICQHGLRLRI